MRNEFLQAVTVRLTSSVCDLQSLASLSQLLIQFVIRENYSAKTVEKSERSRSDTPCVTQTLPGEGAAEPSKSLSANQSIFHDKAES